MSDRWWGQPIRARRHHVFENGRSLCGNWMFVNDGNEPEVKPDEDTFRDGKDCKNCSRRAGVLDD